MSDFRANQYVKVMETNETVLAGGLKVPEAQELGHIRVYTYKHGQAAGSERLRAALYRDAALTNLFAASSWARLADANWGAYWIGWLRFDFDPIWLLPDQRLWLALEPDDYTRDGDDFYLSFVLDWGVQVYGTSDALAVEVYGYRRVAY